MANLGQLSLGLLALCAALSAQANIQIKFVESAPKDSFIIKNIGACDLVDLKLKIDLSMSQGKLIFDTTATGAGVEVFQPFEIKNGNLTLASAASVSDGDTSLSVSLTALSKDSSASFTIDVDDTLTRSALGQIRVTGAEIQGAEVRVDGDASSQRVASFNDKSTALIELPCK